MAGKLKEVRTRITSVISTQQITKAMKMVSAAKLRKAQEAILQMRPYALKMGELLSNIAAGDAKIEFAQEREVKKVLIVAITSDKGLAGAFNANVVKAVKNLIAEKYSALPQKNIEIMFVGKKAYDVLKRSPYQLNIEHKELFQRLSFENVAAVTEKIKEGFVKHEYDEVMVIYNRFKNAGTQILETEQFLPVQKPASENKKQTIDYIYDPGQEQLIEELVPKILNTTFFRYILDSNASEHGARMTAMDKASDNANELLRDLRIAYNRARQAAITTELTEIVSGAAALQEG